jgi:hypothetical protein
MLKKILLGGFLGGVVVFIWGAIAHMALPLGQAGISQIPDEESVLTALRASIKEKGLYFFPGFDMSKVRSESEQKAWEAKLNAGPSGIMVVTPSGGEAMTPKQLGIEFASNVVASLLAAILLSMTNVGYIKRVLFVMLLGVFGWMTISVPYWTWYGFPTDFTIAALIEEAVGWLAAGLVLAAVVRPSAPKPAPVDV